VAKVTTSVPAATVIVAAMLAAVVPAMVALPGTLTTPVPRSWWGD
jgi:hypothetical protein